MKRSWKKTLLGILPVLIMALAVPLFMSCDAGTDGGQPTGPDSTYDPSFPEGSLLSLSLSPSNVAVGNEPVTVSVNAQLRSEANAGTPTEGVPIFFLDESNTIMVEPNPSITNSQGRASATAVVEPGTPVGSYTISAWSDFGRVTIDEGGPLARDYDVLTVSSSIGPLTITTASLPSGFVGSPYSFLVEAAGGTGPGTYVWSMVTSTTSLGISSTPIGGIISGTPSTAGIFDAVVTVRDDNGDTASKSYSVTILP